MPDEQQPTKKEKSNPVLLSIQFIKTQPKLITNNENLFRWEGTHYNELKDTNLHKLIFAFFEDQKILPNWRKSKSVEMIDAIKYNSKIPEIEELDPYDSLINLNNLTFDLTTFSTDEHTPTRYFSYKVDIDYDPSLTKDDHPTFTEFLDDLFRTKDTIDEKTKELVLYMMAYLLYPQIKMEKMFIFLGGGANGKSILIEIIKSFFPDKYITSLSLNVMSNDESFNRNPLFYSRLNISTEAKVGKKVDSEEIKKISSGEEISLRNLHREAISNFKPKTKIVLAANDFPYFNDTSDGLRRRLCIIEFKNQFLPKHKYKEIKDPQKHDVYLAGNKDEIIKAIKEEKSAIFNTLMRYLRKLKENDWKLPETQNTEKVMIEYEENADVLGSWLKENYIVEEDSTKENLPSSLDILNDFREYYQENFPGKINKNSIQAVGRKIKQIFRVEGQRRNREVRLSSHGVSRSQRVTAYPIKRIIPNINNEEITIPQEIPLPDPPPGN